MNALSVAAAGENTGTLLDRYERVWRQVIRLSEQRNSLIERKSELIAQMSEAQDYLDTKDEVLSALEKAQKRLQERSKLLFENLLTSLLNEVMPHKDDKVVFNTYTLSNKTALDIELDVNGNRESIEDKGGSIKNIMSLGLRFITVARSRTRRILILDEPDCWLRAQYIRPFAQIMASLARRIGVQVLLISHHPVDYFKGLAQVVHLEHVNGVITSSIESEIDPQAFEGWEDDEHVGDWMDGVGWRYIRLVNFKSHENTQINLSNQVTILTGDNDIGKTTVIDAIQRLRLNRGSESCIRHGQRECSVEIGVEDGFVVRWTYRRTGSKRTLYQVFDADGQEIARSDSGTRPPEWLNDYLAMPFLEDIDIHLQRQETPTFLIGEGVSATRRGDLLSLGQKAYRLQQMIQRHGEKVRSCRKAINDAKRDLAHIDRKMEVYRRYLPDEETLEALREQIRVLEQERQKNEALGAAYRNQRLLEARKAILDKIEKVELPKLPELADLPALASAGRRLAQLHKRTELLQRLPSLDSLPKAPVLAETDRLLAAGRQLTSLQARVTTLSKATKLRIPDAPELVPVEGLSAALKRWDTLSEKHKAQNSELAKAQEGMKAVEARIATAIDAAGGRCLLCGSEWPHKHDALEESADG